MTIGRFLTIVLSVSAVSCSESSDAPAPPPSGSANAAPMITSSATASAAEGASGVVYTATASDADGDTLAFAIVSGADADDFTISASGDLMFNVTPDFERPRDEGLDNIYLIDIQVSDGALTDTINLQLSITNGPEAYRLTRVASGFAAPLFLIGRPGEDDVFVTEREGVIRLMDPVSGAVDPAPFIDISADVGTAGEGGLIGFTPAPDYQTSGVFYVYITNLTGDTEIRRYTRAAGDPDMGDPASVDIILTVAQPAGNHNGGWIGFGADDLLYIALGDGGGAGDPFDNGQDRDTLLGAILRIDPSSDDFPSDADRDYAIPSDNPFASSGGADEIFAYGLRNPYRNSFDRMTGDLYIADVGQGDIEEIDLIETGDTDGRNFGWPVREGTQQEQGSNQNAFTPPVTEYAHGSGPRQGNSVTGGYVYRGPIAALNGRYFFADFVSDNVWSIPSEEFVQGQTISSDDFILETDSLAPNAGSLSAIVSFGEDNEGNLFILTIGGDVFRIDPAP